ncbi:hypothetical protein SAMN03097699_0638 [Flavobacteriaceae bacterium MAR_2010_188]|nr:hypothetical protein SAMN03097699_0638 [Flavobacteriaceae bacterium MAR_2010_188]
MLIRFVKMTFEEDKIDEFLELFEANKHKIKNFAGCEFLELLRDKENKNIFFTHSHWKEDSNLEAYRNSDLFKGVWSETKILFKDKPEAWSLVSSC